MYGDWQLDVPMLREQNKLIDSCKKQIP